jgi:DNA-binding transcriptional regulator PaaX
LSGQVELSTVKNINKNMTKVQTKNKKSLKEAKEKLRGKVDFRQTTKWRIVVAKSRKSKNRNK